MKNKTAWFENALIIFVISLFAFSVLSAQSNKAIYIKAKKIYTCDQAGMIENGGILIEGKKIIKLDKKAKPPKNAQVIDLKDKIIIPGLIDAHSSAGFYEENFAVNTEPPPPWRFPLPAFYRFYFPERGEAPPPSIETRYKASDAVFCGDSAFEKLLAEGITSVKISIPTDSLTGGISFCAKSSAGSPSEFILKEPVGVDFSFIVKENVMQRYGDLKKVFLDAIEYRKRFEKYKKDLRKYKEQERKSKTKKAKAPKKGEPPEKEVPEPKEPKKDENHEVILQILARKIPAIIRASKINEIQAAVALKDEFKINIILVGGHEAYKIAKDLSLKRIPVIAGPEAVLVKKGKKINYIKELLNNNVPVGFCSNSAAGSLFLPYQLAYAVQHGLTEIEALNILSINAAKILGVSDRVGSIAPGKDADFVVLDGKPFDLGTKVERVYIDGRMAYSGK